MRKRRQKKLINFRCFVYVNNNIVIICVKIKNDGIETRLHSLCFTSYFNCQVEYPILRSTPIRKATVRPVHGVERYINCPISLVDFEEFEIEEARNIRYYNRDTYNSTNSYK